MIRWLDANWPAPPGVIAGTTYRAGGVSKGAFDSLNLGQYVPDEPKAVSENRRRFVEACRLPAEPEWLRQTHSTHVARERADLPDEGTDAIVESHGKHGLCRLDRRLFTGCIH